MLGILGLAAFAAVYYGVAWVWNAGWRSLNRGVLYRGKYRDAMAVISEPATLATDYSVAEAINAVRERLQERPGASLLRVGIDITRQSETRLLITVGNL